jgi:hypothetical protein
MPLALNHSPFAIRHSLFSTIRHSPFAIRHSPELLAARRFPPCQEKIQKFFGGVLESTSSKC